VGGQTQIEAYLRRVHFTNAADGSKKRCYGLFTIPEDDTTDDGHSDAIEDLYLGGGTGVVMMCTITQLFGTPSGADYFGVTKSGGGSQFLVAKSIPSRPATGANTYTPATDNSRDSYNGATHETQSMVQPFTVGDVVWVIAADHTGVTVSGSELLFLEVNTEREWGGPDSD
jgi:hypothetical protein